MITELLSARLGLRSGWRESNPLRRGPKPRCLPMTYTQMQPEGCECRAHNPHFDRVHFATSALARARGFRWRRAGESNPQTASHAATRLAGGHLAPMQDGLSKGFVRKGHEGPAKPVNNDLWRKEGESNPQGLVDSRGVRNRCRRQSACPSLVVCVAGGLLPLPATPWSHPQGSNLDLLCFKQARRPTTLE